MRVLFLLLLIFTGVALLPMPSHAQENATPPSVRASDNGDYTRLVLEWPSAVSYTLSGPEAGIITLKFAKVISPDTSAVAALLDIPRIGKLSVQSAEDGFELRVPVADKADVRDFSLGGKVVIDIYAEKTADISALPAEPTKPEVKAPPENTADNENADTKEPESETETPEKDTTIEEAQPAESEQPEPDPLPLEEAIPAPLATPEFTSATLTVTTTSSEKLAVFTRFNQLYILTTSTNPVVDTKTEGGALFPLRKLDEMPLEEGGKLYRYLLPETEGFKLTAEGGGLIWRITLAEDKLRATGPTVPETFIHPDDKAKNAVIWPVKADKKIFTFTDPNAGDLVSAVAVGDDDFYFDRTQSYVDFDVLSAPVGFALASKSGSLNVDITPVGVEISMSKRPLALAPNLHDLIQIPTVKTAESAPKAKDDVAAHAFVGPPAPGRPVNSIPQTIFSFEDWEMTSAAAYEMAQKKTLEELTDYNERQAAEALVSLARQAMMHGQAAEAIGYLRLAGDMLPELRESSLYQALNGLSRQLNHQPDLALEILYDPRLNVYDDVALLRTALLSELGDFQQAARSFPADDTLLNIWPQAVETPVLITLAETALRSGNVERGISLLARAEVGESYLPAREKAALAYLRGEVARQAGKTEDAKKIWTQLSQNSNPLYRTKAGLALIRLSLDADEITKLQAIDELERLRYAWRGDELEMQILIALGEAYFSANEYFKGFSVLRNAATLNPDSELAQRATKIMLEAYRNLFGTDVLENVPPVEAVTVFEEFSELAPPNEQTGLFAERLAEQLVESGLYERAAALLDDHAGKRMQGESAVRVATRLAALNLLSDKPEAALTAIENAETALQTAPADSIPDRAAKIATLQLIKARALAKENKYVEALKVLDTLPEDETLLSLKANIAWRAGSWTLAAQSYEKLIERNAAAAAQTLDESQARLVLMYAVALNLAGQRTELAELRSTYDERMAETPQAKLFQTITRPRRVSLNGTDRETLGAIMEEVDIFKDFLESYKKTSGDES